MIALSTSEPGADESRNAVRSLFSLAVSSPKTGLSLSSSLTETSSDAAVVVAADAPEHLNPGGSIYLEVGAGQADAVRALLTGRMECAEAGAINDLNGIPRVVWARSV